MALGSRDIIYFFMGAIAVFMVICFSAYQLTTYDSVRDSLGGIAAQPSQVVDLHAQYNDLVDQFANGRGDVFTYHYGSQAIDVTKAQAAGKSEAQVRDMMLDKYANNFYNGNVPGSLSMVTGLVGAGANGFYFIMAVLLFAAFLVILVISFLQQWFETIKDMLKSSGKIILIMGALSFVFFLIMPSVVKSMMWASISSGLGRDVIHVIEPRIYGAFLVNTLILVLFGALLYGLGFFVHVNTVEEPDAMGYLKHEPRMKKVESRPSVRSPPPAKPGRRQL
jgi:hypothetical protein